MAVKCESDYSRDRLGGVDRVWKYICERDESTCDVVIARAQLMGVVN